MARNIRSAIWGNSRRGRCAWRRSGPAKSVSSWRPSRTFTTFASATPSPAPTVTYEILMSDKSLKRIDAPSELPDLSQVAEIREPYIVINLIVPTDSVGAIIQLCEDRRGVYKKTEYIGARRVILVYEMPLAEVIYDFYDRLKSATKGYGTMDYDFIGFRVGDLVKMDILVNADRVDAL